MKNNGFETIENAIRDSLISPNETDRNLEDANVVDGLFAVARAINRLADAALESNDAQIQKWERDATHPSN